MSTPLGFTSLTRAGFSLKTPFVSADTITILQLESESLETKLAGTDGTKLTLEDREEIENKLTEVKRQLVNAKKTSSFGPFFWNLLSLVVTVMNLLLPAYIVLKIVVILTKNFLNPSPEGGFYSVLAFEERTHTFLGSLEHFLETIVIMYMITAAFVGFYKLPWVTR